MTEIPSGKDTHVPQADGAPAPGTGGGTSATAPPGAAAAAAGETHRYEVTLDWAGDGMGCGVAHVAGGTFSIPIGGAKELGGCGKGANSEEMLLAAVGTCWIATWAILLKNLGIPHPDPRMRLTGELGKDPAGGFRMTGITIHPRVPAPILAAHRPGIEKTVALAEKYCIISKVAKAAMPVNVVVEEI